MTLKFLTLSELKKKVDQALEEHGDLPVTQWSECDDLWFGTLEVKAQTIHTPGEFTDDGQDKEELMFCIDYT